MDQKVACTPDRLPSWTTIAAAAAQRGLCLQMRMIDGQLAFPDEAPPDDWRELRVAVGGDMITLRREADGIRLVTWGNAGPELRAATDKLAAALGELTAR